MSATIKVVVLMICLIPNGETLNYNHNVNGLTFGEVKPEWINITEQTGYGVLFMEMDLRLPNHVLLIESSSLRTLDLTTNKTHLIAGKADTRGYREGAGDEVRFNAPFSFHQIDGSEVIVLDSLNKCIRRLSRDTNQTSILTGWCTILGDADGSFQQARFGQPEKVVQISPDELALTDASNLCIRKLDMRQEQTSTLLQLDKPLHGLTMRPHTRDLYFSFIGGFGFFNLDNNQYEILTQSKLYGSRDGDLSDMAVFSRRPETMLFITYNVMLIAGFDTHLIRVVNLMGETVSSVCNPRLEGNLTSAGGIRTCLLSFPRSLLAIPKENRVLIGLHESLGYMEMYDLPDSIIPPTTTVPTTSTTIMTTTTTISTTTTITTPTKATTKSTADPTDTAAGLIDPASQTSDNRSNKTVTTVGIAVGGVAFIAVIIGVIFAVRCWYNKRDNNTNRLHEEEDYDYPDSTYESIGEMKYETPRPSLKQKLPLNDYLTRPQAMTAPLYLYSVPSAREPEPDYPKYYQPPNETNRNQHGSVKYESRNSKLSFKSHRARGEEENPGYERSRPGSSHAPNEYYTVPADKKI